MVKKVGETTHKRISQMPKMRTITHFHCEDVSWVDTSFDVAYSDGTIMDPLTDRVLAELHVLNLL
jgi:hypothetical protein